MKLPWLRSDPKPANIWAEETDRIVATSFQQQVTETLKWLEQRVTELERRNK